MGPLKVVIEEKLADTETAVSAYLKLCADRADSFLLESAETHESIGRYSIIAFDPIMSLTLWPDEVVITDDAGKESRQPAEFFDLIRRTVDRMGVRPKDLPAVGSLMGYIGFDAVRLIEKLGPAPTGDLPISRLVFPSRFVIFDHRRRVMILVALAPDEASGREKLARTEQGLTAAFGPAKPEGLLEIVEPDRETYMRAVTRAKEYIREGEIFQVVIADRFEGRTSARPFDVYRLLRVKSPSPYMFFQNFGDFQIVGASPETLVKVRGNKVIIRPIAGTRGRSDILEEDLALEKELVESEKERAEHIMLVDLGRNDAGRVCGYGTVTVNPYLTVERYSHVMHLVSQVQGFLRDDADSVSAFMAGFPAGTVSGAPKVRAMQIIDELEDKDRGPYSGAIGYFGPQNDMDTCIAIRMVLFQGDKFKIPVGAGIVADSIPEMEYEEIQHKAAQSLAAVRAAARGEL